jgi:AAA family ATP:ADP antiporter
MPPSTPTGDVRPGVLDRLLLPFGDVRAGEGATTLLLLLNVFLLLAGYYVCKVAREPLVLATGGAAVKSYASAAQAVVLMAFIPAYSWFASRVDRMKLITGVILFFALNLELFWLGARWAVPYLGVAFFVWVGIFNNAVVAQFWSYGNDLFSEETGKRLFPVIGIGATLGSPLGSALASGLFIHGVGAYEMLQVTAAILLVCLGLFWAVERREGARRRGNTAGARLAAGANGFTLIARSPYLRLVCLLLLLLNVVNTTGQFVMDTLVAQEAAARALAVPGFNSEAWLGTFYAAYNFWVSVAALVLQAFLVSRIVRYAGLAGLVLALPVVALGSYGVAASLMTLGAIRAAKTAENATDYSIMNTARQMLWLVTTREEKYKAKQAADTFVVRAGDVLAAGLVFAGTTLVPLGTRGFALVNVLLAGCWLWVGILVVREYRRLSAARAAAQGSEAVTA